jgi:hypothetical protein
VKFQSKSFAIGLCVGAILIAWPAVAASNADDCVFLFTSFQNNGEKGLQFLHSKDGYSWQRVPGYFLTPHVGTGQLMRDPSLVRGPDGTFHLVWTAGWKNDQGFGYAHSKDLLHWSDQRFVPVMAHEPTTVNVWAPEIFYDERAQRFIICWASTIPGRFADGREPHDNNQRMYFTTTRDFETFAPAKLFLDPGFSVIDGTILQTAKSFVLVLKDNSRTKMNLRVAFADSPVGPWRDVSQPLTQQFTEGPSVLKLGNDFLIYFDAYRQGAYGAIKTRDFKSFTDITQQVSFPAGHKHGTVLQIPKTILDHLLEPRTQ